VVVRFCVGVGRGCLGVDLMGGHVSDTNTHRGTGPEKTTS